MESANLPITIVGSCVTRDIFNFCENVPLLYYPRQSIISSCSHAPYARRPTINSDISSYYNLIMRLEIEKSLFTILNYSGTLIIDLIDERFNLALFEDGSIINLSEDMKTFTDIQELTFSLIPPLSDERRMHMTRAISKYVNQIKRYKNIIIHKAFLDDNIDKSSFIQELNFWFAEVYSWLQEALPNAIVLEVPRWLRRASKDHKWGPAAYHFVDEYYIWMLRRIAVLLGLNIKIDPALTMQKIIRD